MRLSHAALSLVMLLTACTDNGDSKHGTNAPGSESDPWSDPNHSLNEEGEVTELPDPETRPFTGLVSNRLQWSDMTVEIASARQERGIDERYPERTYVVLELAFTALGTTETGLDARDTWDLVLADSTRLQPAEPFSVHLLPTDETSITTRYDVKDWVDLGGSRLELYGGVVGDLEPETIPLDAPYKRHFPLIPGELVDATLEAPAGAERPWRFEITNPQVSPNSLTYGRASLGMVWVEFDVRATYLGEAFGGVDADNFRISVDGKSYEPVEWFYVPNQDAGESDDTSVTFEIPDDARQFDAAFLVAAEIFQRISVDLDSAALAEAP
jgi:hypothetical protein